MKLNVPKPGDKIFLAEDWTFLLEYDIRNYALADAFPDQFPKGQVIRSVANHVAKADGDDFTTWNSNNPILVTLPKDTEVELSNILFAKTSKESNVAVLFINNSNQENLKPINNFKIKFYVSLEDFNNLEF